jgi:hypothetical protein
MSWLSDLIHHVTTTSAIDFVRRGPLGLGSQAAVSTPISPHDDYLSVRVSSLRLPNTRQQVFNKVYGLVHAFAELSSAAGTNVQFAAATMPNKLAGVDPSNLQNVLTIDKIVVGPTPWNGGSLNLQIGLFSVVSENLAGPFLDTMTKLTETVGVTLSAAAKPYIETLRFGVQALTRAAGSVKLEIGLDEGFTPPATGYFALVAEAVGKLAGKTLTLDPADKKLLVDGMHYIDKPYLIFSIERTQERDNFGEIPELKTAYAEINDGVQKNDRDKAKSAFETFRRLALFSPDLTRPDANRIAAAINDDLNNAFRAGLAAGGGRTEFPSELRLVRLHNR